MATVATKVKGARGKAATMKDRAAASAEPTALAPATAPATGRKRRAAAVKPTAVLDDAANAGASHAGSGYSKPPTVFVSPDANGGTGVVTVGRTRPTAGERGAKRLAETFKLAGDATRLRVLTLLAAKGGSNVGDMAREFGVGQPALSHHLSLCRHSGVIEASRRGKESIYSLTPKGEILARMALELGSAE